MNLDILFTLKLTKSSHIINFNSVLFLCFLYSISNLDTYHLYLFFFALFLAFVIPYKYNYAIIILIYIQSSKIKWLV